MDNHQLSSVSISNFMSLRDVSVELGNLNLLIGPNGAGKSNFLALFDMRGAFRERQLGNWIGSRGGADRVLFGGSKESSSIRIELNFDDVQGYNCELAFALGGGLYFSQE